MCNFITGVLEASADTPQFRELVSKYQLLFQPIHNPHVASQLKASERYFHVTRSHCDCSTNLSPRPKKTSFDREVRKLHAKGWSQSKIDRWLESKGPRPNPTSSTHDLLTHDEWTAFLDDGLELHTCRYIGLMMHFYKRSTNDEQFTISERLTTTTQVLRSGQNLWKEDVLYEVRAQRTA